MPPLASKTTVLEVCVQCATSVTSVVAAKEASAFSPASVNQPRNVQAFRTGTGRSPAAAPAATTRDAGSTVPPAGSKEIRQTLSTV